MTAQEVLDLIQQNAVRSFQLMQENNRLLQELVFSRRAEELTDADIQELEAFAGRLFAYANSEDNGIAYKIHELLLHTALLRQDEPFIIRELYNCGVTLHYLNIRDEEYKLNTFGDQVRAYFEKAADYLPRYEAFDSKTRGYLIRCLGNSKMSINRNDPGNSRIYLDVFERAMGIMNDPYYQKLDPEIPWNSFIYTMHMDQLSLLPYLRHCEDPEIAQKVWERPSMWNSICRKTRTRKNASRTGAPSISIGRQSTMPGTAPSGKLSKKCWNRSSGWIPTTIRRTV